MSVLWHPDAYSSVLRVVAFPEGKIAGERGIVLSELGEFSRCVLAGDAAHVLLQRSGKCLQLEIRGQWLVTEPAQLLMGAIVEAERLGAILRAFEAFGCLCSGQEFPRGFEGVAPGSVRLNLILKALDGWQAGLSQREIAVELFGPRRVYADWGRGADHLKSHVRRLIRRGRCLIEGGYRALLR